ncbi:MAG: hypothetical protein AAF928_14275 [Myxococcota bacterium]
MSVVRGLSLLALASLSALGCSRGEAGDGVPPTGVATPEIRARWAAFSRCVVGPQPLGEGERASVRMRASELTAHAQAGEQAWPAICLDLAAATVSALEAAGATRGNVDDPLETTRRRLQLLVGTQPDMFLSPEDKPLVDQIWEAARQAGLDPLREESPPGGFTAPPPAKPAGQDDRVPLGTTTAIALRRESAPDEAVRRVVWGGGEDPALACRFSSAEAALDSVTCETLAERSASFVPLSGNDPKTTAYFDPEPTPRVVRVGEDGSALDAILFAGSPDTFAFSDGSFGDVQKVGARAQVLRRRASGRLDKAPLPGPPGGRFLDFVGTAVTWLGPKRGTGLLPLSMQSMGMGRAVMTLDREVGEVPPGVRDVFACRRGVRDVTVALLGREVADDGTTAVAMVSRQDGTWGRPVTGRAPVPASGKDAGGPARQPRMQCHADGSASLVWQTADARVGTVRCGSECTPAISAPIPSVGQTSSTRVALMGDAAVVVRLSRRLSPMTGVSDAVLVRIGPVGTLATVADRVLIGDEDHGGLEGLRRGVDLVATEGAAVVFVRDEASVFAIRVTPEGNLGGLTPRDD